MYVDLQQFCFHCLPVFSTRLVLFQGNTLENRGKRNPKWGSSSLSGQGKIDAQQIHHGTADKPTAKRQVVNNSARTALIAGTAGSKFQPGLIVPKASVGPE